MKTFSIALTVCLLIAGTPNRRQQETASKASAEPSTPEEIKKFNTEQISALENQIAGKENQPSEAVFKNIKILTGIPAGNLLKIMQMGFSQSLGTSCAHCHVVGQWEKEDKPTKQIARDMWNMDHAVVSDYLKKMEGLKDRNPLVNCTTCHRGQLKPALNLEAPKN
jgi:Photosynthetic reaction centre cytochrome C subunit